MTRSARSVTSADRPRIPAARPSFTEEDRAEIIQRVDRVLQSGRLILGEYTHEFEEAFRQYVGTTHAVAVSSCTAALQIVLRFYRVRGREVLLPTNNFPGVVSAVLYEGGIPVLADMDPTTFCVDTQDVLGRISARTAGILVVHLAGLVYPGIDSLRTVCAGQGLFLIEDASHAHGAHIDGRKAGSLADAGCFSFYPTKIMTTALGGMITTDNPELATFARSVRHHGTGRRRDEFVRMGNDWCMSEIHAVLGLRQLVRLDAHVDHRLRVAGWYREHLAGTDWITFPVCPPNIRHAYYKLPMLVREDINRDKLRLTLEDEFQIENGTVYDPPCHLQPIFRDLPGICGGPLPKAESTLPRQFCPPIHSQLSAGEVHSVVEAMMGVVDRCRI